jgi:hypothetical protein
MPKLEHQDSTVLTDDELRTLDAHGRGQPPGRRTDLSTASSWSVARFPAPLWGAAVPPSKREAHG